MSHPRSRDRFSPADLPDPRTDDHIEYNPSFDHLRDLASDDERTTEFGSAAYVSAERSRNADRTKNAIDDPFDETDAAIVDDAVSGTQAGSMLCLDRRVGGDELSFVCRYFVPTRYARIALAWAKLLDPVPADAEVDFYTVQLPDHEDVAIRVLPDAGFTAVLGSDYTGEAKKSFLRLFMYEAKQRGGLGLHAGSKRLSLEREGEPRRVGQLFLGLSATGKSTLTCHGFGLTDDETAAMVQDDVCALLPSGTAAGSEGSGLYIKTQELTEAEQPGLYRAATAADAVLENVDVDEDGTVDFFSERYTANGRAVVARQDVPMADDDIDLEAVDQVFFITRNPVMPPVAKLDPTEGAAAFMLGESVQTSAGDPERAGEAIRVVGTNPFIVGPPAEEGNRFRRLIEHLGVDCYVLNTGQVGDRDVGVADSVSIVREIARGTVQWHRDDRIDLTVPASVPGVDLEGFDVPTLVEGHGERLETLRRERRTYLETFDGLDPAIVDAVY